MPSSGCSPRFRSDIRRPGSTIVTSGWSDGPIVRVLQADSGEEVRFFRIPWFGPGFAMSPDRSTLATSLKFGGPALWDVASGRRLRTLHASPDYADQIATGVAFSPDGRFVASLAADALFWEIASGRIVLHFPAHTSLAWSVTFSPDGSKIATSGRDGAAIWMRRQGIASRGSPGSVASRTSGSARMLGYSRRPGTTARYVSGTWHWDERRCRLGALARDSRPSPSAPTGRNWQASDSTASYGSTCSRSMNSYGSPVAA
jgi:WD40 repeat protein